MHYSGILYFKTATRVILYNHPRITCDDTKLPYESRQDGQIETIRVQKEHFLFIAVLKRVSLRNSWYLIQIISLPVAFIAYLFSSTVIPNHFWQVYLFYFLNRSHRGIREDYKLFEIPSIN